MTLIAQGCPDHLGSLIERGTTMRTLKKTKPKIVKRGMYTFKFDYKRWDECVLTWGYEEKTRRLHPHDAKELEALLESLKGKRGITVLIEVNAFLKGKPTPPKRKLKGPNFILNCKLMV
jgi:hypothetical protein